ncbi:MAG: recombination protein RmuC [Myxococcales bacterium]|nr:recombination protein RmuC [Myxococcales bacterium]
MELAFLCGALLVGAAAGGWAAWMVGTARVRAALEPALREGEGRARAAAATADALRDQVAQLTARATLLEDDLRASEREQVADSARAAELQRNIEQQRQLLDEAKVKLGDTFQALAAQALQNSNEGFLTLATERLGSLRQEANTDFEAQKSAHSQVIEGMVRPVRESLERVDQQIKAIERERGQAYGVLTEQVRSMVVTQEKLKVETGNLVNALRAPAVRGRWGEIQLRRVVELAGMVEHCDFDQQATVLTDDGRLRPDLVVRMPSGRNLVVDAKAPLGAYLEALEATTDEERAAKLRQHAAQVKAHVTKLAAKSYWEQFRVTPEFVVMFLPGEIFYGAALEQMPSLIEESVAQRVFVCTPTTLIALLQAVHYGWRQERIAENAELISRCGREVYDNLATLMEHFSSVGSAIGQSVKHYNAAMASLEARVLGKARKLAELGAQGKKDLPLRPQVDARPRALAAVEPLPPLPPTSLDA